MSIIKPNYLTGTIPGFVRVIQALSSRHLCAPTHAHHGVRERERERERGRMGGRDGGKVGCV